jgi:hypothetical protein
LTLIRFGGWIETKKPKTESHKPDFDTDFDFDPDNFKTNRPMSARSGNHLTGLYFPTVHVAPLTRHFRRKQWQFPAI